MPKPIRKTSPRKPRADFPLSIHPRGYWCKKVRGRSHYFGKVADDPKGEKALAQWLQEKDDLLAGRSPRAHTAEGLTVTDLCNHFLTHKRMLRTAGEITAQTEGEYHATCERLLRVVGRNTVAESLTADDFRRIRADTARHWGPVRLANEITRIKGIFRYGYDAGLLDKPPRYGPEFKKPSAKVLRQNRAKRGLRMFEREELLALLDVVPIVQKAMVLLAINGGLGNYDIAHLPMKALKVKSGWLIYPRAKTGIDRKIPLWPETIEAVNAVLADRHEPKDAAHKHLVFISVQGEAYIAKNSGHRIAKTVLWFLRKAKIDRPGLTFYALRHTFQTIAEGARDLAAVQAIMGHAPASNDMSATYRERVTDERLQAVVGYVHNWLWPVAETKETK